MWKQKREGTKTKARMKSHRKERAKEQRKGANYKKDCREAKWAKLRMCKKQTKQRWAAAVAGSGSMPMAQKRGDDCTFEFCCRNHPWAKMHGLHEAWFSDLVAFCGICGAVNSKKETMQNQRKGRPTKEKGKSEPNGLKTIRVMKQGSPSREWTGGPGPRIDGDLFPALL